jgi:prepilin-type N-terminal cleavage/methylation domain-containing protein
MHTPLATYSRLHPASPAILPPPRSGFTLVELLVATVVLAVGLLALTSAGAAIVRLEARGQRLALVAAAGEDRLELLRMRSCSATSGVSRSDRIEERWSVTQPAPGTLILTDSVTPRVSGGPRTPRTYTFRSAVRC